MKKVKSKRWRSWPYKAIRTKDGQLHPICWACDGTGHPTQWISRSDEDGGRTGHTMKKEKCRKCEGRGYEWDAIRILDDLPK